MAVSKDTHCLFSCIKNTSGGRKKFSFLPPHGRELAANEEYVVFGNIADAIAQMGGDRVSSRRYINAFLAAINRGDLQIMEQPQVILRDDTTAAPKMLRLNSGTLGVVDPCWFNTGSIVSGG